ncbi:hypothetical protein NE237_006397 [Protea cynaroides]|uniref:Uncharacterized protein n=1 Tax=Protea cynaroides TaxID=273540 RepID=A0A9Q0KMB4_9MAGN|nr:hypothetical protein NE237_006397 [Protea cynaroides]
MAMGSQDYSRDSDVGNQSIVWVDSIRTKISQRSISSLEPTSCIYRVHQRIRQVNNDAYTPDTVSIGPYHRPNPNLEAMENHKLEYLHAVLDRTKETTSLEKYVEDLKKLEPEARKCYSEPIDLTPKQFTEMMLIDGFFIVEYFRKFSKVVLVDETDPIFNSKLIAARVVRDLVLLENQIPFLVLKTLFDMSNYPKSSSLTLIQMALMSFVDLIPNGINKYPKNASTITHKHLVDLLSYTLSNSLPKPSTIAVLSTAQESLPSVMELQRSGVKFKKGSISKSFESLIHIKFHKGIFEIPPLCIHDHTDSFFRNLIAYEQCHHTGSPHITSYAILMDYLINSANDVALLRNGKIIINLLGNDEKVSFLFSSLCDGISSNGFCYDELCNEVDVYYNKPYHYWKAAFKRKFCNSPWSIISVCTAFVLLFLTAWATVFSTFPFYNVRP